MIGEALSIFGFAMLIAALGVILKDIGFRGYKLYSTLGVVLLFGVLMRLAGELVGAIEPIIQLGGVGELASLALKIVGVGYVYGIAADVCRDMGESGIANTVLAVGRVEILLISVPSIVGIVELAAELIGE